MLFRSSLSLADEDTCPAVSGMHAGTGYNQVPDTGEAAEGLEFSAHGGTKPGDLRNSPCDQGRFFILPETEAVRNPRRKGHHILQGAAQLHPQDVRADINPECLAHKQILDIFGRGF